MKLPNGYGSVYKLGGRRRNPWVARKFLHWTDEGKGKFKYIGYYKTKAEALQALAEYNENPSGVIAKEITLEYLYTRWSEEHFEKVSRSNARGVIAAWSACEEIKNIPIQKVNLDILQGAIDSSGKNTPTLKKVKTMLNMMFKYAVAREWVPQAKADIIQYLNINKGNPNAIERDIFTQSEINKIWDYRTESKYFTIALMLIYTGCRVSELLELKSEDVNLEERWFDITHAKTPAGIRRVPIAEKIVPFFEMWSANDTEYLLTDYKGPISYDRYRTHWGALMSRIDSNRRPHDTRHTFISLLAEQNTDERLIKQIVGHAGSGITAKYTHLSLESMLDAVNNL